MNNQPKFKKGDSPVVDMLAIPDDHVWPVTSDNEVVIVDEPKIKLKNFHRIAAETPYEIHKKVSDYMDKLDIEYAAKKLIGEVEDVVGVAAYNGFIDGANWKAEQVANDAIEFISDTMGVSKESIINLYEIWQQSKNR